MVFADVDLGDLILTAIWVFFLILFIWLFIAIVSDLFRDHELSGGAKALWVVGLILFPLFGSLVCLRVRGAGMARGEAAREHRSRQQFESYVRDVAGSSGPALGTPVDDLTRLAELRSNGIITGAEFDVMKARL